MNLISYAGIIGATFILEDPTTIAVGSMINAGKIGFSEGFIALFIGIFLGDLGLYGVGRLFARKRKFFVPVTSQVVLARFLPGARTLTFLSCGHSRYPLPKFTLLIIPSIFIWTLLLLKATEEMLALYHSLPLWANIILGVMILFIVYHVKTIFKLGAMITLIGTYLIHHTFSKGSRKELAASLSAYAKMALWILNIRLSTTLTKEETKNKLVLSNHISYLDILCLSSVYPTSYVTSVEIRETPVLGKLCELAGCLFTERRRGNNRNIDGEINQMAEFLKDETLTLFPEGTSTNGESILPFRSSLLESAVRSGADVLPVVLCYGEGKVVVPWTGKMTFLPHLIRVCRLKEVSVTIEASTVISSTQYDRRELTDLARTRMSKLLADLTNTD